MKVSYGTDIGIVREDNQDSVFAHVFDDSSGLFIVADGMGGYEGGELASSKTIEIVFETVNERFEPTMNDEQIRELLQIAVQKANTEVFKTSCVNKELYGMGTTVVACIVSSKKLYTANVGDSRCYLYRKGEISQITTDHSLVYNLISRGLITKEEARVHPRRNVITRAIGSEENVTVDVFVTSLEDKDVVLMCSDGLHTMVSDEEMASNLKHYGTNVSKKLIKLANENGGMDNISVIAVKISDEVKK